MSESDTSNPLEAVILDLCARADPGRTISPTDAARAFAKLRQEGELGWQKHLHGVRAAAMKLAGAGRIVIFRKGKPVDPADFRGVYRLGSPRPE